MNFFQWERSLTSRKRRLNWNLNTQKLFLVQSFWRDLFVAQDCWIYMKFFVTFLNHVLTRWNSNGHCIMRVHFTSKVFDFYSSFSFHCQRCFVLHFKPSLLLQSSPWIVNFNLILYFKIGFAPFKKYLVKWKPLKNEEKCFSFPHKSSCRSQDI